MHHAAGVLRRHTPSSSDRSGRWRGGVVRSPPGSHAPERSTASASPCVQHDKHGHQLLARVEQLFVELGERRVVSFTTSPYDDVPSWEIRDELRTHDLAKSALQEVPCNVRPRVLRHDEANPRVRKMGSGCPDLENPSPDALPFARYSAQVGIPRQPKGAREAQVIRRRRTSTGAAPSAAGDPSYGGDSELHVPIWSTSARGIHGCECGACCGDGRLAYPYLLRNHF